MSHAQAVYIEAFGEDAGLIVAQRNGYRFYAAHPGFVPLEGRIFKDVASAERAARELAQALKRSSEAA